MAIKDQFSEDSTHIESKQDTFSTRRERVKFALDTMMNGPRINIGRCTLSHTNGSNLKSPCSAFTYDQSTSGKSVQLPYHADGAYVDITVNIKFTASAGTLGLWLYKPPIKTGSTPSDESAMAVYFTRDGFSNFLVTALLVRPGLHFYTIPVVIGDGTSPSSLGLVGTNPATTGAITTIRLKNGNASISGITYGALTSNDAIEVGDMFIVNPPKAKFVWCFDDCKLDLLHPTSGKIAGYDGESRSHSYLSFLETYGWRATCFAISGAVGQRPNGNGANFLTVSELHECIDKYGAVIANHSKTHPEPTDVAGAASNTGFRLLGPYGYALTSGATFVGNVTGLTIQPTNDYTGIYNDLETAAEQFLKWGFEDAAHHFAIPQGSVDSYVNTAIQKMGFTTVRGIDTTFPPVYSDSTVNETGLDLRCDRINIKSSVQTDQGSAADSVFRNYVNNLISGGSVGSNYCHSFGTNAASRTQTKALADYVKILELQGLIDVVTVKDL